MLPLRVGSALSVLVGDQRSETLEVERPALLAADRVALALATRQAPSTGCETRGHRRVAVGFASGSFAQQKPTQAVL